jgi:hypothetical protein
MMRAAILGAGKIAQGFDDPGSGVVLTHVNAYRQHGGFEVVAFCDSDLERARAASRRWNVPHAVGHIGELATWKPDIISICTPDATHLDMLEACLGLGPRLVFCEKPLALDAGRAGAIVERYRDRGVGLMVNYSRRWSDSARACLALLREGACGRILSVRIRYYGGWFHNGSHLADLIGLFFNPSVAGGSLLRKDPMKDGDVRLTGSAVLKDGAHAFPFHFECLPGDRISHLELELMFENSSFWMGERDGTVWKISGIRENSVYPGYFELTESPLEKEDPSQTMRRAAENVYGFLTRGESPLSSGVTALATLETCGAICSLPETVSNSIWQSSQ